MHSLVGEVNEWKRASGSLWGPTVQSEMRKRQ